MHLGDTCRRHFLKHEFGEGGCGLHRQAEAGEVPVNTGSESKGQRGLCRLRQEEPRTSGWELGGQDAAAGVGVPETLSPLTTDLCKGPTLFNS